MLVHPFVLDRSLRHQRPVHTYHSMLTHNIPFSHTHILMRHTTHEHTRHPIALVQHRPCVRAHETTKPSRTCQHTYHNIRHTIYILGKIRTLPSSTLTHRMRKHRQLMPALFNGTLVLFFVIFLFLYQCAHLPLCYHTAFTFFFSFLTFSYATCT